MADDTAGKYTKPSLRDGIKSRVMAGSDGGKPGQWSARKAQLVAQKYESAGGGYSGAKTESQKSLSKWTDQKWTTSDGKPAERKGGTTRYLPEKAWDKLSPSERSATNAKKREGSREGEQFVKNTEAAAEARKEAMDKYEKQASTAYMRYLHGLAPSEQIPTMMGVLQRATGHGYHSLQEGRQWPQGTLRDRARKANRQNIRKALRSPVDPLAGRLPGRFIPDLSEFAEKISSTGAWQRSEGKNPEGGLNAKGRASLKAQGHDIKPGVKGPVDTPEKLKRKGSFLSRMFGPGAPGSMKADNGEPSRRALSAKAWGEAVPSDDAGRARLYAKGQSMLKRYSGKKEAEDHAVKTVLAHYGLLR